MPKLSEKDKAALENIITNIEIKPQSQQIAIELDFLKATMTIATTLKVPNELGKLILLGLCASGEIRYRCGDQIIEWGEIPVGEFAPTHVCAEDLLEWFEGYGSRSTIETAISERLVSGVVPGRTISWKEFCDNVRNACNGWDAKGKPTRGFSDKNIQRIVNEIRRK